MLFEVKLHVCQRCHVFYFVFFFPTCSFLQEVLYHEMGVCVCFFNEIILPVYM